MPLRAAAPRVLRQGLLLACVAASLAACAPPVRGRPDASPVVAPVAPPAPIVQRGARSASQALESPAGRSDAATLDALAGQWTAHSFILRISPDGAATADWRTYRWCEDGEHVATTVMGPTNGCDSMEGSRVVPGGHARLLLAAAGPGATGQVLETTDPSLLPAGPVRLLVEGDRVQLVQGAGALPHIVAELCRPRSTRPTTCGA